MKTKIMWFVLLGAMLAGHTTAKAEMTSENYQINAELYAQDPATNSLLLPSDQDPPKSKIRVMATSNTSETPALEGINKMEAFSEGDDTYLVTQNSAKAVRRAAAKFIKDVYRSGGCSYDEYRDYVLEIGMKPKPKHKIKLKR